MRPLDCNLCSLSKSRKNVVNTAIFGDRVDILFVADAPSAEDDKEGKAFIGKYGVYLRNKLNELNIKNYGLTYICSCKPEDNRKLRITEIKKCFSFLKEEIFKYNPKLIVCFGNSGLEAFFPDSKYAINLIHGKIFKWYNFNILFTYHPYYVLLNNDYYFKFINDLKKAKDFINNNNNSDLNYNFNIIYDKETLYNNLKQSKFFAFDFETTGLDYKKDDIFLVSLSWDNDVAGILDLRKDKDLDFLQSIMLLDAYKITHSSFDLKFLMKYDIKIKNYYADTLLMNYLVTGENSGLEQLAVCYTDYGGYEEKLMEYKRKYNIKKYYEIDEKVLYEYAAIDSIVTYKSFFVLHQKLIEYDQLKLFQLLMRIQKILNKVEWLGVRIDHKYLEDLIYLYQNKIIEFDNKIKENVYVKEYIKEKGEFNINSNKQLKEILIDKLKLKAEFTEKGNPKFGLEILKKYGEKNELCYLIAERKNLSHILNTFLLNFYEKKELHSENDYRLHTKYYLTSTATGRPSSKEPNLNNIPRNKEIKNLFIAEDDSFILEMDQGQAEFRVWIQYSKDPVAINDLKNGYDIHKIIAATKGNVNIPINMSKEYYENLVKDITKEERQKAKNCVFGIMYGRSAKSIAEEFNISEAQAKKIIDFFFSRYKKSKEFIDYTIKMAKSYGFVKNFFNRRRYFYNINSNDSSIINEAKRQAINTPIQSGASDLTLYILDKIYKEFKAYNLKSRLILTVYDSLIFNVLLNEKEIVYNIVKDKSDKGPKGFVIPLKPEIKVGYKWGELEEVNSLEELNEKLDKLEKPSVWKHL